MTNKEQSEATEISLEIPAELLKSNFNQSFNTCMVRQADLVDCVKLSKLKCVLIGAGSIGSWAAIICSKLGISNWSIFDYDHVGPENVANQIYGYHFCESPKVEVLGNTLQKYSLVHEINVNCRKIDESDFDNCDIILCCVDNMETRRFCFEHSIGAKLFFDGRIGKGQFESFIFDPNKMENRTQYESNLYTDDNSTPYKCTEIGGVSAPIMTVMPLTCALTRLSKGRFVGSYEHVVGRILDNFDITINTLAKNPMMLDIEKYNFINSKKPDEKSKTISLENLL